jgi:hypothetical protein
MNVIALDIPLLVIGLAVIVWQRIFGTPLSFQIWCQVVGTMWAQYSLVVSWSLARIVPFLAASMPVEYRLAHSVLYVPLVLIVIAGGLVGALFWPVPEGVAYAYGEGRVWVQIIIFGTLCLTTRAFGSVMLYQGAPQALWKGLVLLGIVHGLASLYQYAALLTGLPIIGISRAHNLVTEGQTADFAAFALDGFEVFRPGGLAGEPKTAAAVFGVVLLAGFAAGVPSVASRGWKILFQCAMVLSLVGFLGALSTSGYIGAALALMVFAIFGLVSIGSLLRVSIAGGLIIVGYELLTDAVQLPSLTRLLSDRTLERLAAGQIDGPVEVALQVLQSNFLISVFGTGIGGGTFYIEELLNIQLGYALTPNVGIVALTLEIGVLGFGLLMGPFAYIIIISNRSRVEAPPEHQWPYMFLIAVAIATMSMMLAGSGIPLGYPLAIGTALALGTISSQRVDAKPTAC